MLTVEELESRLPPEMLKIYREAFSVYDINGDGVIENYELVQVMKNIGASMNEIELQGLLKESGVGDSVDFHAFLQIMFSTSGDVTDDTEQSIRASFRVLDADGDGLIGVEELKLMLQKLGEDVSDEQLQQVISIADKDNDGKINIDDFIRIMK